MPWNPDRYHQFQNERFAPFSDLISLIQPRPGMQIIDLGCGTGELTQRLAALLPESEVLGIDNSPEMLERAAQYARPGLRFQLSTIQQATGEWNLVFSNAAIHWVEDHQTLIPQLLGLVQAGGQLVVQLPSNHGHPAHTLIIDTALSEPFREALGGWVRHPPVLPVEVYAELLYMAGGRDLNVFEKVYPHVLKDADALADWTLGTAMVPYLERLPEELREPFIQRYRAHLWEHWPTGPVFYGFRRILFAAMRM